MTPAGTRTKWSGPTPSPRTYLYTYLRTDFIQDEVFKKWTIQTQFESRLSLNENLFKIRSIPDCPAEVVQLLTIENIFFYISLNSGIKYITVNIGV